MTYPQQRIEELEAALARHEAECSKLTMEIGALKQAYDQLRKHNIELIDTAVLDKARLAALREELLTLRYRLHRMLGLDGNLSVARAKAVAADSPDNDVVMEGVNNFRSRVLTVDELPASMPADDTDFALAPGSKHSCERWHQARTEEIADDLLTRAESDETHNSPDKASEDR